MSAYSFKRRFVAPVRVGLGLEPYLPDEDVENPGYPPIMWGRGPRVLERARTPRPKRQTIRAVGKRRHARPGEIVQLYHGMRTKQCFKIGDGRCTKARPIELRFIAWGAAVIDGGKSCEDCFYDDRLNIFAQMDGFNGWEEMKAFWKQEHGDIERFEGLLIQWEQI